MPKSVSLSVPVAMSLSLSFLISKDLDLENKKSYISELKSFFRGTGCYTNTENLDSIRTNTIAQIMRKLENNYLNFW